MLNLLSANWFHLRKSLLFWGTLGLCAALATGLEVRSGGLAFSGAVIGMFLLGAAVCAGVAASGSVMKLMKTEE